MPDCPASNSDSSMLSRTRSIGVGAVERALRAAGYQSLGVPCSEVRLDRTISPRCGQAFRWREHRSAPLLPNVLLGDGTQLPCSPNAQLFLESQKDQEALITSSPLGRAWSLCLSDRVVLLRQDDGPTLTPHDHDPTAGNSSSARGQVWYKTIFPPRLPVSSSSSSSSN